MSWPKRPTSLDALALAGLSKRTIRDVLRMADEAPPSGIAVFLGLDVDSVKAVLDAAAAGRIRTPTQDEIDAEDFAAVEAIHGGEVAADDAARAGPHPGPLPLAGEGDGDAGVDRARGTMTPDETAIWKWLLIEAARSKRQHAESCILIARAIEHGCHHRGASDDKRNPHLRIRRIGGVGLGGKLQ